MRIGIKNPNLSRCAQLCAVVLHSIFWGIWKCLGYERVTGTIWFWVTKIWHCVSLIVLNKLLGHFYFKLKYLHFSILLNKILPNLILSTNDFQRDFYKYFSEIFFWNFLGYFSDIFETFLDLEMQKSNGAENTVLLRFCFLSVR